MTGATKSDIEKIAFVFTAYQQQIILAICLQLKMQLDVLVVSKSIQVSPALAQIAGEVIRIENVPYSWRRVGDFCREFKLTFGDVIARPSCWLVLTHSVENPFVRLFFGAVRISHVDLFEEGTGSYIDWGRFSKRQGLRATVSGILIKALLFFRSPRSILTVKSLRHGWALFQGCFPNYRVSPTIIDTRFFARAVALTQNQQKTVCITKNSIVFVQSAYVESGLLTEDEYIEAHLDAVKMIEDRSENWNGTICWKLHPRTNPAEELARIETIASRSDSTIEIIDFQGTTEGLALQSLDKNIQYWSLGSTSLYTIFALTANSNEVFALRNSILSRKTNFYEELLNFYLRIGLPVY